MVNYRAKAVLLKLDVNIDSVNVKACHRLKSNKGKKAILKVSRRKDSDDIPRVRGKLKTTDLKSIGINPLLHNVEKWPNIL